MNRDRRYKRPNTHEKIAWTWCKACRKRAYRDEGDALVVAVRAAKTGTQRDYECPTGYGWHLTRKPKRGSR